MRQKRTFEWDEVRLKIANAIAEGDIPQEQIMSQSGIPRATFYRLIKLPEFQAKVKEITDDIDITLKKNRLKIIKAEIKRVNARLKRNEDKPTSRDLVALVKLAGEEVGDFQEHKDVTINLIVSKEVDV